MRTAQTIEVPNHESTSVRLNRHLTPRDIVRDPSLAPDEKKSRLAAWASDAGALPDAPSLRRSEHGAVARIDEILDALAALDEPLRARASSADGRRPHPPRRRREWHRVHRVRPRRDGDDPRPPAAPALRLAVAAERSAMLESAA